MKELFLIATFAIIGFSPIAFAENSVHQDLTVQEQKVLDDIAKARADGTYIQPPEAVSELLGIDNFETKLDPEIQRPDPNRQEFRFNDSEGKEITMEN